MAIILTTTPDLPGATIVPVGLVFVQEKSSFSGSMKLDEGLRELEKKAMLLGAQAVVGIQFSAASWGNNMVTCLIGTAVRLVAPNAV